MTHIRRMPPRDDGQGSRRCNECSLWWLLEDYPTRDSLVCDVCTETGAEARRRRRMMGPREIVGEPSPATDRALDRLRLQSDAVRPSSPRAEVSRG